RVAIPVGEERRLEVERLHPRDVRPGRVARDRVGADARRAELVAPVTQELQLARSGRRPVEEIEEEQDRPVGGDLAERRALLRRRPDGRVGNAGADGDHADAASVASAISRTTSTMSRFALNTRSWR